MWFIIKYIETAAALDRFLLGEDLDVRDYLLHLEVLAELHTDSYCPVDELGGAGGLRHSPGDNAGVIADGFCPVFQILKIVFLYACRYPVIEDRMALPSSATSSSRA